MQSETSDKFESFLSNLEKLIFDINIFYKYLYRNTPNPEDVAAIRRWLKIYKQKTIATELLMAI